MKIENEINWIDSETENAFSHASILHGKNSYHVFYKRKT